MYEELMAFLQTEECFIEAEGRPSALNGFINKYNKDYGLHLSINDNGIICLGNDANKWGLELRLYVRNCPPASVKSLGFTHNIHYRDNFSYRLNNNQVISFLFSRDYKIGFNRV